MNEIRPEKFFRRCEGGRTWIEVSVENRELLIRIGTHGYGADDDGAMELRDALGGTVTLSAHDVSLLGQYLMRWALQDQIKAESS